MSLGKGCPWKGECKAKVSAYEKKQYCNSDFGCEKCKHRPLNASNKSAEKRHDQDVSDHNLFSGMVYIIVGIIALAIAQRLGLF